MLPLVQRTAAALSNWLAPAFGRTLELRPDLDQLEALSPERDALWARLEKTTFLTDDEKRALIGYPPLPPAGKFNPSQARVSAGSGRASGQWTSGAGGAGSSSDGGTADATDPTSGIEPEAVDNPVDPNFTNVADTGAKPNLGIYSPDKYGWHTYTAGPNEVCAAALQCSKEEIADYMARHAVPGQDPTKPVSHGQESLVFDPRTGLPGGYVNTYISNDGLKIVNVTQPLHILHDGYIERTARQDEFGSWSVTTRGVGNNVIPGMNSFNSRQGPKIFDVLDFEMRNNILRHHGKK